MPTHRRSIPRNSVSSRLQIWLRHEAACQTWLEHLQSRRGVIEANGQWWQTPQHLRLPRPQGLSRPRQERCSQDGYPRLARALPKPLAQKGIPLVFPASFLCRDVSCQGTGIVVQVVPWILCLVSCGLICSSFRLNLRTCRRRLPLLLCRLLCHCSIFIAIRPGISFRLGRHRYAGSVRSVTV